MTCMFGLLWLVLVFGFVFFFMCVNFLQGSPFHFQSLLSWKGIFHYDFVAMEKGWTWLYLTQIGSTTWRWLQFAYIHKLQSSSSQHYLMVLILLLKKYCRTITLKKAHSNICRNRLQLKAISKTYTYFSVPHKFTNAWRHLKASCSEHHRILMKSMG